MRVALHACCGPCLLEPFDALASEHEVFVVYANPNIHPLDEYVRRRDTLLAYAEDNDIAVFEVEYRPERWVSVVGGVAGDPDARCERCFELRLRLTAEEGSSRGAEAVATTLSVSPYQDPDAIRRAGEKVCAEHGLQFIVTDFRPRYQEAVRRSKELGMYRQRYCGCVYSEAEAERARRERRERRKRR